MTRPDFIFTIAALVLGLSAGTSLADAREDTIRMFGRDPGPGAAHACFVRHYTKSHLASHPDQNVTDMMVYVGKDEGEGSYFSINLQVNFRTLSQPFIVSGGCSLGKDGRKALECGVECDGGSLSTRVKDENAILISIPESVRLFDPATSDEEENSDLPRQARFGADDKLFRLDRARLRDCLPLIYDEDLRARVAKGAVSD